MNCELKLTLLGTGTSQGVPMIGCHCEVCCSADARDRRLRTSAMIEAQADDGSRRRIIIDAGPDFRYQMLRERIDQIDAILLTHPHKDHIGGIDDVRAFNYWQQRATDIYCEKSVAEIVRKDYDYAFADQMEYYPGVPDIKLHLIDERPFVVCGIDVVPIRAIHYKMPILGYRIGGVCYLTDANYVDQRSIDLMSGCDVLVINALRRKEHISHFTLAQALELIEKVAPRQAILTHISHQMGLYDEVQRELPKNVMLGYDGQKIIL